MMIVKLINELMQKQGKTIDDMIEITGLSHWIIEDIILNQVTPTPEQAKIMLGVLGVNLRDVLSLY